MRLYLASTSPARLQLLRQAGIEPVTISPGVDEEALVERIEAERGPLDAPELVQALAQAKAEAVLGATPGGEPIDGLVLGGDSVFVVDGRINGKPHRPEVARERWLAQSGRSGELWSGHWLVDARQSAAADASGRARGVGRPAVATVEFARLDEAEIDAYIATGEPLEVAGAFTVDSLGGPFIRRVEGDPSTVVGLSLATLRELVRELGATWTDLWNRR
ncbi:septum formation inhibitor Maf [Agromyces protaetiae]|uniref:Nucleoside triphosphate pyrophosphatase n=1 Tax=Agromyces protaetiae TaxID=2509455 RepID=A0A4P6FVI0_9MICO|nr:Maf family protein [Agromyces protaetiae]QAY74608.1 septum formation inhibitor Maf [Agromyces protaetiae]